jgi:hypothetical protein
VGFVFQQTFHIRVEGHGGTHDAIMTAFHMLSRCRLDNVLKLVLRQWDAGLLPELLPWDKESPLAETEF